MPPTIGSLYVYPVKSCKGIALQQAVLTTQGLLWDREWVVSIVRALDRRVVKARYGAGPFPGLGDGSSRATIG